MDKFRVLRPEGVDVYVADISMNSRLRATYPRAGVPMVAVFHEGLEVWRRVGGSVKAEMILPWVDDLIPGAPA